MHLIEFMKLLELLLKFNRLALQMLNLQLFHYSKFQSVRAILQQTSFDLVTPFVQLEAEDSAKVKPKKV